MTRRLLYGVAGAIKCKNNALGANGIVPFDLKLLAWFTPVSRDQKVTGMIHARNSDAKFRL